MPLYINNSVTIPDDELELRAIHAQGSGGQNVNKVATAIHLRFDIRASSLPEFYQQRLLQLSDQRISKEGVIVIKAQRYRTQEKNREEALQRLREMILAAIQVEKPRKATRPTRSSQQKRLQLKSQRAGIKQSRSKRIEE